MEHGNFRVVAPTRQLVIQWWRKSVREERKSFHYCDFELRLLFGLAQLSTRTAIEIVTHHPFRPQKCNACYPDSDHLSRLALCFVVSCWRCELFAGLNSLLLVLMLRQCQSLPPDWEIPRTNMGEIPTIRHSLPMLTVRYLVFASFYCLIVNVSLLLLWSRNGGRFHVELPQKTWSDTQSSQEGTT